MRKFVFLVICSVFLIGCAGPRYTGYPIEKNKDLEVVIIENNRTRSGFQKTIEMWLKQNDYAYSIAQEGTKYQFDKINIEYVGHWSWDVALYLSQARISAFNMGQKVGEVEFRSPNTLNLNKFGSAEERIGYMLDFLFGKITLEEANVNLRQHSDSQDE